MRFGQRSYICSIRIPASPRNKRSAAARRGVQIDTDVLVIGAGISGLTAAFALRSRGLRVEIVEAAGRVGGVIGTESVAGVLYERGPNSVLDTAPRIRELLHTLGLTSERIDASPLA